MKNYTPTISIIIPTYNEEKNVDTCLNSILKQKYPKNKVDILIIDGGSKDNTLKIVNKIKFKSKFKIKSLHNKYRDAESGKSIGIRNSSGEIVALLDADNEIAQDTWLSKMIIPMMKDPDIFGVESFYLHSKKEYFLNRYFTEIQLTDPLARCFFPKLKSYKKNDYIEYNIEKNQAPPIGANGFLWRRSVIEKVGGYETKFEETNFASRAIKMGFNKFAKIEGIGIHHYYVTSFGKMIKKRIKIAKKFLMRKNKKQNTWVDKTSKKKVLLSIIFCFSILGPLIEGIKNFRKSREIVWFLHPLMCFLTVLIYSISFILFLLKRGE